ncbi:MAG: hypothetical protein AB1485_06820, partial [Candidatus Thermoplasmatota archaeon]
NNSIWSLETLSLDQCIGYSDVRICFIIGSDWCTNYEGWYVDDIVVKLIIPPVEEPTIAPINQTIASLNSSDTAQVSWDTTIEGEGTYKIIIRTWLAGDGWSLNNEKVVRIIIKNATFSINLQPGWNFITIIYNTTYKKAEDLAQAIPYCEWIRKWNATTQAFETHKKGTNDNNFTIEVGVGYYVYVTASCSFNFNGSIIKEVIMNLQPGWNSIGWFNSTTIASNQLLLKIPNCTAIAYWNTTLGRFITHTTSDLGIFEVLSGKGYMVYVVVKTVWTNH